MRRLAAALVLVLVGVAPAVAVTPVMPARAWTVDMAASSVTFASSFDGAAFTGGFGTWSAEIGFDPANLAGSRVTATFDTGTVATRGGDYRASLLEPDWFDSAAHRTAAFTASEFKALGEDRYLAVGALSLRGVTKPLTLPFTVVITGDTAKMDARVGIDRLAFGVGQNEWKTTESVPGTVTVDISLTAKRAT